MDANFQWNKKLESRDRAMYKKDVCSTFSFFIWDSQPAFSILLGLYYRLSHWEELLIILAFRFYSLDEILLILKVVSRPFFHWICKQSKNYFYPTPKSETRKTGTRMKHKLFPTYFFLIFLSFLHFFWSVKMAKVMLCSSFSLFYNGWKLVALKFLISISNQ
jgi:hypothetical protein